MRAGGWAVICENPEASRVIANTKKNFLISSPPDQLSLKVVVKVVLDV
jgi:hypothetical protein